MVRKRLAEPKPSRSGSHDALTPQLIQPGDWRQTAPFAHDGGARRLSCPAPWGVPCATGIRCENEVAAIRRPGGPAVIDVRVAS
jgi:hypothetical protein